jgi:signal transduction histidine kinase
VHPRAAHDLELTVAMADAVDRAVLVVGDDGVVLHASARACAVLATGPGELIGRRQPREVWECGRGTASTPLSPDAWPVGRALRLGEHVEAMPLALRRGDRVLPMTITCVPLAHPERAGRRRALVILDPDAVADADDRADPDGVADPRTDGQATTADQGSAMIAAAFQVAPTAMVVAADDGRVVVANAAFDRLRPAGPDARRSPWWSFVDPLDRVELLAQLRTVQRTPGATLRMECRGRTVDGEALVAAIAGAPLDADGARLSVQISDISASRRSAGLRPHAAAVFGPPEAAARADVDREQLEAQLAQSQRFETIGRLAGGVAHDFNNLLGVISNYAGFLSRRRDLPDALRHDVHQISEATRRGAALTRQLLLFGRREEMRAERFDLGAVLGDLGALMSRPLRPRVDLVVDVAPGMVIEADKGQIEQMVLNLLINARDALPQGGTVRLAVRRSTPGEVLLEVRDDGIGIPEDVRDRVFEPFFTTKRRGHANGLGLAIVQRAVEQSGGTVEIDSVVGEGTVVSVRLPAAG